MSLPEGVARKTISGVGSGLIDFLVHADDQFLDEIGIEKGGMTLASMNKIESILEKIPEIPTIVPGGAACNTIVGISQLGGFTRFIGKVGSDSKASFFKDALLKRGVESCLLTSELPTGRVLTIITPDAERTMLTYLGASSVIAPYEITHKQFEDSKIVHIEGYLLFNPDLMLAVLKAAKASGALLSLDLASFTVVDKTLDLLNELIPQYVDILIANEDEARAYSGFSNKTKMLDVMAKDVSIAALKLGGEGSYISSNNRVYKIPAYVFGDVIDTTGAGDLWASGLLFGLIKGFSLEKCGKIASICGGGVCGIVGADIPNDLWNRINNLVSTL